MKQENNDIFSGYSERFSKMIDFLCVSRNKFAIDLGYKRPQAIYDSERKRTFPSFDFFYKFINSEYSENISIEWVIAGKGEMMKSDNLMSEPRAILETKKSDQQIKIISEGEYQNLKRQIDDLITINKNLSNFLDKNHAAEGA